MTRPHTIQTCEWAGAESHYPAYTYSEPNPKGSLKAPDMSPEALELVKAVIVANHGQSFWSGLRSATRFRIHIGHIVKVGTQWVVA